jgi:hypothetical protein
MATSVRCVRVNHPNVVLEDFDATVDHLTGLFGMQFVADLDNKEWHAALINLGRVLFEVFTPHAWLLNSRYGPHWLGCEFEVADLDEARAAIAERGIRILRDLDVAVHTHPADTFGMSFEFYAGNFHDQEMPFFIEQMKPAEYWRDEHPLGVTGLKALRIAVDEPDAVALDLQSFVGAAPAYEEDRPAIGGRAIGLSLAGTTAEVLGPTGGGVLADHVRAHGDGIRSTVFQVVDLGRVEAYFAERGVTLVPGDAPGSLAVPAAANRGVLFEFAE